MRPWRAARTIALARSVRWLPGVWHGLGRYTVGSCERTTLSQRGSGSTTLRSSYGGRASGEFATMIMAEQHIAVRSRWDRRFSWATAIFAAALGLHAADHLRRGMNVVPHAVMVAGMVQIVAAAITVVLVVTGSRWAPYAAVAIGFASAVGFTAAHLLPTWGAFSDSFINAAPAARVKAWFSWVDGRRSKSLRICCSRWSACGPLRVGAPRTAQCSLGSTLVR